MVSRLKHQYIVPATKVISLAVYNPILQGSIDASNEPPVAGEDIGDDE